jgi:hypothetical protein
MAALAVALEIDLCDLIEAAGFSARRTNADGPQPQNVSVQYLNAP